MKVFEDMNLEELKIAYLNDLHSYRDSIPNDMAYKWLQSIAKSQKIDLARVEGVKGYLTALRDCGRPIGYTKLILEYILSEIE